MKLITGTENIRAAIKSIKTRGKKLDADIGIAAVSSMAHHAEHGDVTLINDLVASLPAGTRSVALKAFILANGKVTYDEANKVFIHDKTGEFDMEGALAKPWTDYKPEAPFKAVDLDKGIVALITKAQAALSDTANASKHKVNAKTLAKLQAFAGDMGIELPVK